MSDTRRSSNPQSQDASARQVAAFFVRVFFSTLNDKPEDLHRYYASNATLTHGITSSSPHIENTFSGIEAIRAKIDSMDLHRGKYRLAVECLEAQYMDDPAGILIFLEGSLVIEGDASGTSRRFMRTFVLKKIDGSHFVLNDMFFFRPSQGQSVGSFAPWVVEEKPVQAEKKTSPKTTSATAPAPAAVAVAAAVVVAAVPQAAKPPTDSQQHPEKPAAATPREEHGQRKPSATVPTKTGDGVAAGVPKSYAAKVAALKPGAAAAAAAAPSTESAVTAAEPGAPQGKAQVRASRPQEGAAKLVPAAAAAAAGTGKPVRADENSIYIKLSVTAPSAAGAGGLLQQQVEAENALRAVYSRFGTVVGMKLVLDRNFAFVDFETAEQAEHAVSAGEQTLGVGGIVASASLKSSRAVADRAAHSGERPSKDAFAEAGKESRPRGAGGKGPRGPEASEKHAVHQQPQQVSLGDVAQKQQTHPRREKAPASANKHNPAVPASKPAVSAAAVAE